MAIAPRKRQVLGQILVERGLISLQDLEAALAEQKRTEEFLGKILSRMGLVSEDVLVPILADQLGIPHVRLRETVVESQALSKVPAKFANHYTLLPIRVVNNTLEVAIADPFDVQTVDELRLLLDCDVRPVLAGPQEIREAIQRHYGLGASAVQQLLSEGSRAAAPSGPVAEDLSALADDASIVSFVNQLILQAVKDRATDIHIEPYERFMRIRQRIDGVLHEVPIPQDLVKLHQAVISRVKVMAKMDIAERRLPQDGRIKVRLNNEEFDLRISVVPTNFGEGIVIRLLSQAMLYSLEQLGLAQDQLQTLAQLIDRPHGIILVTGPTGSGKTTTLYACLSKLNSTDRKILTIEDPIEYQLAGITQIQVHPKIGLSFAQGLRSMLRHDPDVMMVGEVRDPETAEITIRSALTGHLVFSTLHTNDASGGITRLLDMGVEPFLVSSSVLGFIAQRLVRVICRECQDDVPASPALREQFCVRDLPKTLKSGRGCPTCKGTGYRGRTAIYEFLVVDEPIQRLILQRASSHEIARAAQQHGPPALSGSAGRAGMRTLRQDGWLKIAQGITTPQEVLRVT
jgi:type II secretion system protein E